MQDPLGSFLRIRELYLSYLDTAFRIANTAVAERRSRLLREPGTLCTEPLLEPLPRYAVLEDDDGVVGFDRIRSDNSWLCGCSQSERDAIVDTVLSGLFPSVETADGSRVARFAPYAHQVEMLRRGLVGEPCIVTSGTGSGKTESFLLPVLARIAQEATQWEAPGDDYLQRPWWVDQSTGRPWTKAVPNKPNEIRLNYRGIPANRRPSKKDPSASPFQPHRVGERRPAAVRALVLYPMNALVEDQLTRLRKALDSREARTTCDKHFAGNRIFFGRYTGKTPVTGHHLHPGLAALLQPGADVSGDVYAPDHRRADPATGRVSKNDVREAERARRDRKLQELFDVQVGYQFGQEAARLHALDSEAAASFARVTRERKLVVGATTPADFLNAVETAGRRDRGRLTEEFRLWTGFSPDAQQVNALDRLSLEEDNARCASSAMTDDDAPFVFPSVDGAELTNRWDMQETPPDILVTNVSMLGAMLAREVDAPIFEKTREWLEEPDSYFYLILDELHLQRGAAGSELSQLLRLLFDRLGLVGSDAQRSKLRVLASSASLPTDTAEATARSAEYLGDMYGSFGLRANPRDLDEAQALWSKAIVPGREIATSLGEVKLSPIVAAPFISLLKVNGPKDTDHRFADPVDAVDPRSDPALEFAWNAVAEALGIIDKSFTHRVERSITVTAERLAACCRRADPSSTEARTRAVGVRSIAADLFGIGADAPYDDALLAVRAALFVRGCGDGLRDFLSDARDGDAPPSFRLHTFFRSIEGLYAPATDDEPEDDNWRAVRVSALTIDQADSVRAEHHEGLPERLFELVYCECCGELFFGGNRSSLPSRRRRPGLHAELLPNETELEGLPDRSGTQRFEDASFSSYALFWPTGLRPVEAIVDDSEKPGAWVEAELDRHTGAVHERGKGSASPSTGFYFDRSASKKPDLHKRSNDDAGSHVPFACPACGSSYASRSAPYRLSPLRNFRVGFAKTTQLLAAELFDAQRLAMRHGEDGGAKLVSFSDSRQDAAKAALDIESNHHQDMRREILFEALRDLLDRKDVDSAAGRVASIAKIVKALRQDTESTHDKEELAYTERRLAAAEHELQQARDPSVRLSDALGDAEALSGQGLALPAYANRMTVLGVNPFSESGIERVSGQRAGKQIWLNWTQLVHSADNGDSDEFVWRDDAETDMAAARRAAVEKMQKKLADVLFGKSYFSFEEAGLGYATIGSMPSAREPLDDRRKELLSAFLRVIADSYRYRPSQFDNAEQSQKAWLEAVDCNKRVRDFAEAVFGSAWKPELDRVLLQLGASGHPDGVIRIAALHVRLVDPEAGFLRCSACGRVHLHRGAGFCTRCRSKFDWSDSNRNRVIDLRASNYLGKRVERSAQGRDRDSVECSRPRVDLAAFRLHCEELTGQTEHGEVRQRAFRGIFAPRTELFADERTIDVTEEPVSKDRTTRRVLRMPEASERARREIDLLAVTTTMEVGIDIGPLQAVLQANMPPQRFNYQQRVGRAGRRGQAFSIALTICRTRSHDLHYFRHPEKIAGDVPPTPFLTTGLPEIPARFVRKAWLRDAFDRMRTEARLEGTLYPGDLAGSPDVHGDFLPLAVLRGAERETWRAALRDSLSKTADRMPILRELLLSDVSMRASMHIDVEQLEVEIDGVLNTSSSGGLAQALAEAGHLPMYGMPTRVRDLYLGPARRQDPAGGWRTVDRDLDIAIHEFAPGSTLVLDKREYLSVGFTPALAPPRPSDSAQDITVMQDSAFGESFSMVECEVCNAWRRLEPDDHRDTCDACGALLNLDLAWPCNVPNAFRTDLRDFAPERQEAVGDVARFRSIEAEGEKLSFESIKGFGISGSLRLSHARGKGRTYRINRGPRDEDTGRHQFKTSIGTTLLRNGRWRLPAQAIADDAHSKKHITFDVTFPEAHDAFWLAAPKATQALYIDCREFDERLALERMPVGSSTGNEPNGDDDWPARWTGVRAAAISATQLIVTRAAEELDIDPEEFDALEPRMHGEHPRRPLLHITDRLVNGAGYCEFLSSKDREGFPRLAGLLASMLEESSTFPLSVMDSSDHLDCHTSCYRCLRRYGNQAYHALLDLQLGLSFLRIVADPAHVVGLDGDFSAPELRRWPDRARELAHAMARRFEGESRDFGRISAFRLGKQHLREAGPWILVTHPFWRDPEPDNATDSILAQAASQAREDADTQPLMWDTFNLSRRQVFVRERIRTITTTR